MLKVLDEMVKISRVWQRVHDLLIQTMEVYNSLNPIHESVPVNKKRIEKHYSTLTRRKK